MPNLTLTFTESISIPCCLSSIAANRLVLSLRGLYYIEDFGNTTIATTNSKLVYELDASSQFRQRDSTFAVVSSNHEEVDVAMEELSYNWREQAI
jgi:hypothetical protein